jgi:two-component system C4-dicarboxylate transport sensor histidine kinase DctB
MAQAGQNEGTGGRRMAVVLAVVVAALALFGWAVERRAEISLLSDTARGGQTTLRLAVATLESELSRIERLPPLIARTDAVIALGEAPDDPARVAAANAWFEELASELGVSDIYFMDPDGLTRAASNHRLDTTFVGGNFAFRPYFIDAIAGGEGRFFALGTTSGKRGYYLGAPVLTDAGAISGVLVFKIDLDAIETTWQGSGTPIIVTDPEGIVFLSGRQDWLFRALGPQGESARARTEATRRYADLPITALDVTASTPTAEGVPRLTIGGAAFLQLTQSMPRAGWDVSVMIDTRPAVVQARVLATAAMLAAGVLILAFWAWRQRRARITERIQLTEEARDRLEARVAARTAELAAVNDRLAAEVAERTAAEAGLRKAQAELIQASKLAALGQMSAALSHEMNQPLAAVRTFGENALVLIDRGRIAEARGNVEKILSLVGRIAAIGKGLRSFARTPGQKLQAVDLAETIAAAAEIAGPRLRTAGARLDVALAPDVPRVVAGPVRLQQVLVNLMTNAADAVEGLPDRMIRLTATAKGETVTLCLSDSGPGIAPGLIDRIFDPFFSTKEVGKGLGLGLSISYNIVKDFGGDLQAANAPGGGAEFRLTLMAATAASAAA